MSKTVSPEMKAHLANDAIFLSTFFRILRADGVVFGFTNFDEPVPYNLAIDGLGLVNYVPFASVETTSLKSGVGTSVDNAEFSGMNDDSYVKREDLAAGRFDDTTEVLRFKLNPLDLSMGPLIQFRGYIGEINFEDKTYKVETLAQTGKAKRITGNITQATCRVPFCGPQCKLDPVTYTTYGLTPQTAKGPWALDLNLGTDVHADDYFTYGIVTCTSGKNKGFAREVKAHTNSGVYAVLTLKEAFPFPILVTDVFSVLRGCDHTPGVCIGDYDNIINFRGEPHLPGNASIIKVGRVPKKN